LESAEYGFLETDRNGYLQANSEGVFLRDVLSLSLQSLSTDSLLKAADERVFPDVLIALLLSKRQDNRVSWSSDAEGHLSTERDAGRHSGLGHRNRDMPCLPKSFHEAVFATAEMYVKDFNKPKIDEGLAVELSELFSELRDVSTLAHRSSRLQTLFGSKSSDENFSIDQIVAENDLLKRLPVRTAYPATPMSVTDDQIAETLAKDKKSAALVLSGDVSAPLDLGRLPHFQTLSGVSCDYLDLTDISASPGALALNLDVKVCAETLRFSKTSPITVDHLSALSNWVDFSAITCVTLCESVFGSFGLDRLLSLAPNLMHLRLETTHVSTDQMDLILDNKPEHFLFLEMVNCTSDGELGVWTTYRQRAISQGMVIRQGAITPKTS
jgi:hypothetical protein